MLSKIANLTPLLTALAIAGISATGCATVSSETRPCVPIVSYSQDFLDRAADELDALPEGSAIEDMIADYSVMREQARACQGS